MLEILAALRLAVTVGPPAITAVMELIGILEQCLTEHRDPTPCELATAQAHTAAAMAILNAA